MHDPDYPVHKILLKIVENSPVVIFCKHK